MMWGMLLFMTLTFVLSLYTLVLIIKDNLKSGLGVSVISFLGCLVVLIISISFLINAIYENMG